MRPDGEEDDEFSDVSWVNTRAGGLRDPLAEDRPLTQVWPLGGGAEDKFNALLFCDEGQM